MPYTTITTFVDGNILTASQLNTLSGNQEFLHSLGNSAFAPFNSFRITATSFDEADAVWWIRHRLPYLHNKTTLNAAGGPLYWRFFFNGTKYGEVASPGAGVTGYNDVTTFVSLPNLLGAWITATAYDDDTNGDGDVVTSGGSYYKCILSHTSGATNEPGVGASWATYWTLLVLPVIGQMYSAHIEVAYSSPNESTVEYMFQSDSTTL